MLRTWIKVALVAAGLAPAAAAQSAAGGDLFRIHCAVCHGVGGKGDGPGAGNPPPRDLTSGKFSFGTTREAITRTVTNGIAPGMPAFDGTLRGEQIDAVVAYVQSLMPASVEAPEALSRITVDGAARAVRGALPARVGEELPIAHGLFVGLPGGWSLEYRTDDLAPLRAFRGGFVDRADWRGRGGAPLEPLGEFRHPAARSAPLARLTEGEVVPLALRLDEVGERGAAVRLVAHVESTGGPAARWVEELEPLAAPAGDGYRRRLTIEPAPGMRGPWLLRVAGDFPPGGPVARSVSLRFTTDWFARPLADGRVDLLAVRRPHGPATAFAGERGDVAVAVEIGPRPTLQVEVARLELAGFDPAAAETLDREVLR